MSYYCEKCNYTAKNSSNFTNHKKTQKHLLQFSDSTLKSVCATEDIASTSPNIAKHSIAMLVKNCSDCNKIFKHDSSYYRHKKTCMHNNSEDQFEIKLKLEFAEKEKEMLMKLEFSEKEKEMFKKLEQEKSEILKEKTQLLNTFMANANHIINRAQDNTKITAQAMQTVSVSALKYANDKFKDAPELIPILNFNINDLNFDNEEDKKQLTEILIYNAKQKSLDKLLGDHIVKCYKKDNPEEQSFHTTDCSRLNYIVRNLIENALNWAVDKSGIKICSSIVKPLIEKCINLLLEYQRELIDDMTEGDYTNKEKVQTILALLMSIDKGSLESDINKYIAPFFNLNKNIL
jgi:hypothetical protein